MGPTDLSLFDMIMDYPADAEFALIFDYDYLEQACPTFTAVVEPNFNGRSNLKSRTHLSM